MSPPRPGGGGERDRPPHHQAELAKKIVAARERVLFLAQRSGENPGVAFEEGTLEALALLATHDKPAYERMIALLRATDVRLVELSAAVKERRAALRRERVATPPDDPRPTIEVNGELHLMTDQAEDALAASTAMKELVYVSGGELVRIIDNGEGPRVQLLPEAALAEVVSRVARFVRANRNGDIGQVAPPPRVVSALAARGQWAVRRLRALVTCPVLLSDGRVLSVRGYDAQSANLYLPSSPYPEVPANPTRDDAVQCIRDLKEPFADFPFISSCDLAATLALLLTPLARQAIEGPVPIAVVDAHTPGTGKSLLVDVGSNIVLGRDAPRLVQATSVDEDRKRILSLGRAGEAIALIDNVEQEFGNPALCAAATGKTFSDRVLGTNTTAEVVPPFFCVTGNNLVFAADMSRRVFPIRLDARCERPEERAGFAHPLLLAWVKANRPRLVVAALTILRAYVVAGLPSQCLCNFGSFEAWSDLVRQSIVWAGMPDPLEARRELVPGADPVVEALRRLLQVWRGVFNDQAVLTRDVAIRASGAQELRDSLIAMDPSLSDRMDVTTLGYVLRRHSRRIVADLRLIVDGTTHGSSRWRVEQVGGQRKAGA